MDAQKLLVVFDPTREEQPALERAAQTADRGNVIVHLYACIYGEIDPGLNKSDEIARRIAEQKSRLQELVADVEQRGVKVDIEVEWGKDWYDGVVRASRRNAVDAVLKSSYPHSNRERILNRTSDWTLIRECDCPVLLVKGNGQKEVRRILAAIDLRTEKESYRELNRHILDFSRQLMDSTDAEIHFVNAFEKLKAMPDRKALMEQCGVDSDRIHIQIGEPEEVIVDRARAIEASLVVVGNSGRSGLAAAINGNTVEKVLDQLECDVLSMP